ncbi:ankyrin repeat domain-containing protein [Solimonas soli]|uniref:ankyrin repeat domain-containing protein n=1 Tax=Solimonas soli TaxID=413479 RepID=UPI0004B40F32|nr:ankyrin repeat domain-containing protein [Solimonas soli]
MSAAPSIVRAAAPAFVAALLAACAQAPVAPHAASPEPYTAERFALFVNDIRHGKCEQIASEVKAGASIDGFDTLDQTPLLAAIAQNQVACVARLLDAGADVNLADHAGWSPLIHAAYFGSDTQIIELLLARGANINAQNDRGLTALYLASAAGHEPQVQLLLARGADPSIASKNGYTPLRVAQVRGLKNIVALLEARPAAVP